MWAVGVKLGIISPTEEEPQIKARIDEIIMKAHDNPRRRYFLCNMSEYVINKSMYNRLAAMFDDAKDYNIRNFIMPFDIAMHL